MADAVEDIKGRLGIYDVVCQYVSLKKAGHNYKGLCPFHSEKTPSFVVSPEKQICHCFGCNKGGDIFTFIQEVEGVSFPEAMQLLADKAGVKIDRGKFEKKASKSEKDEYFKAHDLAADFFATQLSETNDGKKVLEYLYKRGVKDETIKDFKLGFAPDEYDALHPFLLKKGISRTVLLKSGLVSSKNIAAEKIYDKYRARLIFPIFDYFGRICGFGGRALKKEMMPKYLNSPENLIYNKSKVMYGLSMAKQHIKNEGNVVLVEGYFDVILPYQEGVQNVVATSGTALTSDHVRLLKRLTERAVACFDSDSAGFDATVRAYSLLKSQDMVMDMVELSEKDPADFVKEFGGEEFKKKFNDAKDFLQLYMDRLIKEQNTDDFAGRRAVVKAILPYLKALKPSGRDFYVRELSKKLEVGEKAVYDEIDLYKLPENHPARIPEDTKGQAVAAKISVDEMLFSIILRVPKMIEIAREKLSEKDLDESFKAIYKALLDQYNSDRNLDQPWDLDKGFSSELKAKVDILFLYGEEKYGEFSLEVLELEVKKLVDKMAMRRISGRLSQLQKDIVEAEKIGEKNKLLELLNEQQELLKEKSLD